MSRKLFQPGQSGNPTGRIPGSRNKRSLEFQATLEKHNFNVAEALLSLYQEAMKGLEYGNREERPIYLKIAADLAQNMASYSYPKLKAVEMQKDTVVDVMSPQQKLAAMREAVALLEKQVDAEIDQPKVPEIIE